MTTHELLTDCPPPSNLNNLMLHLTIPVRKSCPIGKVFLRLYVSYTAAGAEERYLLVTGPTGFPQGQLVRRLGVYKALHLCQLHNKVRRTREEIELLAREMVQYMQYFRGKQAIEDSLEKLHHARASAGPSPHLASLQVSFDAYTYCCEVHASAFQ